MKGKPRTTPSAIRRCHTARAAPFASINDVRDVYIAEIVTACYINVERERELFDMEKEKTMDYADAKIGDTVQWREEGEVHQMGDEADIDILEGEEEEGIVFMKAETGGDQSLFIYPSTKALECFIVEKRELDPLQIAERTSEMTVDGFGRERVAKMSYLRTSYMFAFSDIDGQRPQLSKSDLMGKIDANYGDVPVPEALSDLSAENAVATVTDGMSFKWPPE